MKKNLKFITLSAVFLMFFSLSAIAQEKALAWDYPVKPGMEEWKNFQSNKEMVKACQIPENILHSLSTEELTDLCLQYPLLNDVFAFDNLNGGLDKLFSDFNGIKELYKRKDVSSSLTKRYIQKIQSFSFLDENHSEIDKGYFIISISALEILLSRIEQQEDKGNKQHKEALQSLVLGYEGKFKYVDYFKGFGFRTNYYSRSRVIIKIDKLTVEQLPQKGGSPVLFSGMADEQTAHIIDELSYELIK
jgi:hypothetical protein